MSQKKSLLSILPATTLEELRKNVLLALQKLSDALPDPTDLGQQRIANVAQPTAAQDAATKRYVDEAIASALDGLVQQVLKPGESVTITYLTGTPGAGQSSKTVTFSRGLEVKHT